MTGRYLAVTLIAAGAAIAAVAQERGTDRAADRAAIRAHIESIFDAFIEKDRPKLAATHGRNWRGFLTYSRHVVRGRDGYVEEATGSGPMEPKGQGMVGYRIQEYDTVFHGDTAVVSFVADVDYMDGTRPWSSKLTLLDVYAKEDGEWIQVASNTALHPDFQDARMSAFQPLPDDQKRSVLAAREAVWRAWYAGDEAKLSELLPPELVTLHTGGGWGTHDVVIAGSREFAKEGKKLTRLVFPRTEFQRYGNTVILYTSYELDLEGGGKVETEHGLATEIFVRRGSKWLNTGWQLAPERGEPAR